VGVDHGRQVIIMDGVRLERGVEGTFGSDDALFEAKEGVEVGVPGG
jgi:hypothetical protein